jgi:hypothetical protein
MVNLFSLSLSWFRLVRVEMFGLKFFQRETEGSRPCELGKADGKKWGEVSLFFLVLPSWEQINNNRTLFTTE